MRCKKNPSIATLKRRILEIRNLMDKMDLFENCACKDTTDNPYQETNFTCGFHVIAWNIDKCLKSNTPSMFKYTKRRLNDQARTS